ncbi:MAG: class I SAM-dependent methyltransferase family protein [Methanobrevibacter sp.]|jgi:tRNA (guanine37-N1)-methyltransferase|nr:class I SAM-dependent methyltransferase family protein [Candidatus Methanoflexus mossambicus]
MIVIKIPLKGINQLKEILMEKNLIKKDFKIKTKDGYGYVPVKKEINIDKNMDKIKEELNKGLKYDKITKKEIIDKIEKHSIEPNKINIFKYKKSPTNIKNTLKSNLGEKINSNDLNNLKKSFDIIGDIVILEIPEELKKYEKEIAKASLEFTKRKTAFVKRSGIKRQIRTRDLEFLAGENNSKTIYKEHGMELSLDVKNVYFSPRLGNERLRIGKQVRNGEVILDMFAGIGPFSILIAKNKDVKIYATDINEIAIEHMKENIKLNKLKGEIYPILGDINEIAIEFKEKEMKFDRIIMNLPGSAIDFLPLAFDLIKNDGIINYYEFNENFKKGIENINKIAKKSNKTIKIINYRKVKSTSPGMWHIAFDIKII